MKLRHTNSDAPATPWSRRLIPYITAVVVIGIVVAFFAIFMPRKEKPLPLPVVEVEPIEAGNVNVYGEYVGRIMAQKIVELRARVEGYLEGVTFEDGAFVNRNQPLFLIDRKVYQARAEKARALLKKASANARKAERDLARIRPLYEQNAASQLDLDNAVAALESARAEESVAQADLTQAELTLSYTTVSSPISGFISERKADRGTLVGPSAQSLLATVVKSDTVLVDFSMTSLDYLRSKDRNVNLGQRDSDRQDSYVTVSLADGSSYPYHGRVFFAAPEVDSATGTFKVRAEMPNPEHVLMPGEFTKVKVLIDVRTNAIEIPAKAVEIEKGAAYVYVVRPDSVVERRFVETGPELGNNIIIERGLAAGERLVTEGYHKLHHNMKVRPVAAAPADSVAGL